MFALHSLHDRRASVHIWSFRRPYCFYCSSPSLPLVLLVCSYNLSRLPTSRALPSRARLQIFRAKPHDPGVQPGVHNATEKPFACVAGAARARSHKARAQR